MMQDLPDPIENSDDGVDAIPSISLLGVKVHCLNMQVTLDAIREFVRSGKPHMIVTADASGIVIAQDDAEFREIVNQADLVTPDGSGILKGAAMLGTPLESRVSGVDIAREMCRLSAEDGFSVFFLGAEPGVAEQAVENLGRQFPGMHVAGIHHGYFKPDQDAEIAAKVKESGAQALLVAMGIPRQEKFIQKYMGEMGICVAMGVGGSFDVFAGKVKRAPVWFQKHGLEWAYRLVQDPSKMSKVKSLPRFAILVLKEKFCS